MHESLAVRMFSFLKSLVLYYNSYELYNKTKHILNNWYTTTNPFEYIIQQQFYEITPNPNAATTLITDFNITSSKIITADNITTMRSDLNLVTNNVDVMSYDVKEITNKVNNLGSEMAKQQLKTKYQKTKTDETDAKVNVGIALGVAGCVLCATRIGVAGKALSLAPKVVNGAVKAGREIISSVKNVANDIGADAIGSVVEEISDDLPDIGKDFWFGDLDNVPIGKARILNTNDPINSVIEWCDSEYTPVKDLAFSEEADDATKTVMTLKVQLIYVKDLDTH